MPGLPSPVDLDRLGPWSASSCRRRVRAPTPEAWPAFESVRLFVARGGAVKPGFAVTAANAADVAAIVAHLGGVPLAIELAAARLRFLTPAAIHERLEGRLDLPGAGAADVPERQRSLRGAIMWSHELLDAPGVPPVRAVGRVHGRLRPRARRGGGRPGGDLGIDVLDGLASLVDQSLVRSDEVDGEPRFSMLEPIREYALERLEASGDGRRSHRAPCTRLSRARPGARRRSSAATRQRAALDQLELRAREPARGHRLGRRPRRRRASRSGSRSRSGGSGRSAATCARRGRVVTALDRASVVRGGAAPSSGPRRHEVMGGIIYWHGEVDGARPDYEAALAIWREIGDQREIANAAYNLSFCFTMGVLAGAAARRPGAGRRPARRGDRDLSLAGRRRKVEANVYWGIAIQHYFARDYAAAAPAFEAALELYRRLGDRTQEAWSLHQLGLSNLKLGGRRRRPDVRGRWPAAVHGRR